MLAAAAIFGPTPAPWIAPLANAYWMFLFIGWAGMRLGLLHTSALLCAIALVALWGTSVHSGYFGNDLANTAGFGYWSFMMILGTLGLSLASYMADRQRDTAALRLAATTFESQQSLLTTDAQGRILQANGAACTLLGLSAQDLAGQQADALPMDQAAALPPKGWHLPRQSTQQRLNLLHARGKAFPAWATVSPVFSGPGRITHYVIALMDISDIEARQQERAAAEAAQHGALVREVHHRIKNNLQGLIGMLRELDREHPALRDAISRAVSQVYGIAAVHGLKAQSTHAEALCLQELVQAVCEGIAQQWKTPVTLQFAPPWLAWQVAPHDAVPLALALGELLVNAIKHGGRAAQDVALHCVSTPEHVCLRLSNPSAWPAGDALPTTPLAGHGLELVRLLLPRKGALLTHQAAHGRITAQLQLSPPALHLPDDLRRAALPT